MIESLLALIRLDDPIYDALLLLGVGLVLLVVGAEGFVAGSVRLAERLGLPRVTVGLTLVAIGTSLPELSASLAAVLGQEGPEGPELAVGNALGSNASNIGLLLGIAALIRPFQTDMKADRVHLLVMLISGLAVAGIGVWLRVIPFWAGVLGLLAFFVYNWLLLHPRQRVVTVEPSRELRGHVLLDLCLFGAGCTMVIIGADILVLGATDLAKHLGVSADVIGAALVAVGTSVPELAVCISAARRREGAILIGNLVGSNIANVCLVLGACAVVRPLPMQGLALTVFAPAVVVFSVLMYGMMVTHARVTRAEGAVLLGLYVAFQWMLWSA